MGNVATVQAIYEAFGKGDVDAILGHLADDVRWEEWEDNTAQNAGVPELQPRHGKAEVPDFFAVAGGFDIKEFDVISLMEGGDQVTAEVLIEAVTPTGHFRDEELHLWTFDAAGRVIRMRHYTDTAKHMRAAGL